MKKRNLCSRVLALAALMLFCNLSVSLAQTTMTERVVVGKGEKKSLVEGATYTCPTVTAENGGAVSVEEGGTLTGTDVTFDGNHASHLKASGCGGGGCAIFCKGTVVLNGETVFKNNSRVGSEFGLDCYGGACYVVGVDANITFGGAVTFDGNENFSGGAFSCGNMGSVIFNDVVNFIKNKCSGGGSTTGGAFYNGTGCVVTFKKAATFSCDTVYSTVNKGRGGAIFNCGTITFEDNVTFNGNCTDNGGAIFNKCCDLPYTCTINLCGVVTLGTSSDTWVNKGDEGKPVVVNWNLTKAVPDESGTCSSVGIVNFERYNNVDNVQQKITVKAEQPNGDYVIASGDLSDVESKDSFIITGVAGRKDVNIKIGNQPARYGLQEYSLKIDGKKLVLTIDEASFDVKVGTDGYATFYTDVNLKVPEETRVFSYTYESSIKTLIGTEVEPGSILPANQGYVLKGEAKTYKLKMTNKEASPIESVLSGTTEGGPTAPGQIYVLGTLKEVTTFYKYDGTTFPAGKAYFEFPNSETIAVEDNPGWIWIKD